MSALRPPIPFPPSPPGSRAARAGSVALAAGLLAVSLTACSGGGEDPGAPAPAGGDPSAAASGSGRTSVISPRLEKVPKLKDSVGVVKDAKLASCSTEPGRVEAGGTVKNSAKETRDIVVVISWVTPTSDVVARGVAAVKALKAGKSADWRARSTLKYDGGAQCVMTVTAGELSA